MKQLSERIADRIVSIPDYPTKGVIFRDIMPVSSDAELFRDIILALAQLHREQRIDAVVGIESRGFIFGGALAHALGCGFVPVRKAGKLPRETIYEKYQLEYGEGIVEIQKDALSAGARVVLMDDLLATGAPSMRLPGWLRGLERKLSHRIFSLNSVSCIPEVIWSPAEPSLPCSLINDEISEYRQ